MMIPGYMTLLVAKGMELASTEMDDLYRSLLLHDISVISRHSRRANG